MIADTCSMQVIFNWNCLRHIFKMYNIFRLQDLFIPFARVGSSDPVRVLHLFHNEYTGYNYVQLVATESNVLLYLVAYIHATVLLVSESLNEWMPYCTVRCLKYLLVYTSVGTVSSRTIHIQSLFATLTSKSPCDRNISLYHLVANVISERKMSEYVLSPWRGECASGQVFWWFRQW